MGEISQFFFWMGGVVTQPLEPLLSTALQDAGSPPVNLPAREGFAQACEKLTLGALDELDFFREIASMAGVPAPPEKLREALLARVSALPDILPTIDLLPPSFGRWLVVDFPRAWFELLKDRLGLAPIFQDDHILFLDESGLKSLVPDAFFYLAHRTGHRLTQCLLFDADSHHCVSALYHGFPAAIQVDARRLNREFLLREFIPRGPLEHRPSTIVKEFSN